MRRSIPFLLPALLSLAACSTTPRSASVPPPVGAPAPGVVVTGPVPGEPPAAPAETPRRPQPPRQLADGSQLPAVKGLVAAADSAMAKGDVELAGVNLERAQRLAPQSAVVYQKLATVRLRQKRPAEAEQLARKALAYAGTPTLQASLWQLIANARDMQGQRAKAQEARERAASLQAGAGATP